MLNLTRLMKLSLDEERFLHQWMYDEVHYQHGIGPAKQLQLQHQAIPADLGILIAAAIPNLAEQETSGLDNSTTQAVTWPWSEEEYSQRVAEARIALGEPQVLR